MSPWAHLLSVGVVWITFHCAGMCGPIVLGLDIAGAAKGLRPVRGMGRILAYQAGRMTTLGVLGAIAGLAGRGLGQAFTSAGAALAITFGAAILAVTIARLVPRRAGPLRPRLSLERGAGTGAPARSAWWSPTQWVRSLSLSDSYGSAWLIGVALGFLPCMIVVWALGLATNTASPVEGFGIMVTLVAMTTPMLLGVSLLPRFVPRRALAVVPQALMAISGVWMIMVGLAGLDVVPHVHVGAGDYTIMLW